MKKIISCVAVCLLPGLSVSAFDGQMVETAVLRAEAAQQESLPTLSAVQKERFPVYLQLAEVVMLQDANFYLNPAFLGSALLHSVSRAMQNEKAADGSVALTPEEQRAVYYAIYTSLPKKNCTSLMPFKEYQEKYPINNWGEFRTASFKALNLVYQAVKDIATEQQNYRYTWLWLLTH